ncbi:MAG: ribosome small subunit-dependent GTPase A [Bacteroidales bacterium]|nr:ribosome small subunit-dependent GTPase A [Bacteroidales bacterium]MDD3906831.1 ribosome small subunit-dependent GTPase A [Bacteroidales bacterium]MDD4711783.1 ribosome small subunit-dependent GTPase A [Bacteroidales bacterium]
MKGLVVKNTGSWYLVKTEDGRQVECKVKGNFRMKGLRSTNPVAVGDRVVISDTGEENEFITEIEDRKNYLVRKPTNLSKQLHILAANIDQAFLLITIKSPVTNTVFMDRFLASAEAYRIPAHILINKTDIYNDEDKGYMKGLMNLYKTIGYPCTCISAKNGDGVEQLQPLFKDKISLFSGNSGVGKSTLINAIRPISQARTGLISESHHKGMHTTTFSEMYELENGGYLIDTPGIKGFGTIDMKTEEVGHYFPEIFKASAHCRFNNCTHTQEPGCAVLTAIENHYISESRYMSYLSILHDEDDGKYRE